MVEVLANRDDGQAATSLLRATTHYGQPVSIGRARSGKLYAWRGRTRSLPAICAAGGDSDDSSARCFGRAAPSGSSAFTEWSEWLQEGWRLRQAICLDACPRAHIHGAARDDGRPDRGARRDAEVHLGAARASHAARVPRVE